MLDVISQDLYVRKLLASYRRAHGVAGRVRQADRVLAADLYRRGVPLEHIENAFVLAAVRRLYRKDPTAPPLPPIGSLHYFLPIIDEIARLPMKAEQLRRYFDFLRYKIERYDQAKQTFLQSPPQDQRR